MLSIIKEEKNGKIKLTIETENSRAVYKWITDEEAEEIIDRVCLASAQNRLNKIKIDCNLPSRAPTKDLANKINIDNKSEQFTVSE